MINHFRTFEDGTYLIERDAGLEHLMVLFEPDHLKIGLASDHYLYRTEAPLQSVQALLAWALPQGWRLSEYAHNAVVFVRPLTPHADQFVIGKSLALHGNLT